MIETLIEAERALTHGLIDQAERLYRVVRESDPKNSIAVMGLARVALERGDDATAYLHGRAALAIDPDNPAAQHLVMRLAEVMAGRGETPPEAADLPPDANELPPDVVAAASDVVAAPKPVAPRPVAPTPPPPRVMPKRRGVVQRLLGRGRRPR
jgi:thioredoxin-like negative regulator of GroEL